MAQNIYRALVQKDARDSLYYKANLAKLIKTINEVDRYLQQQTAKSATRAFIIYHPALTYFAAEYGFQQLAIEEEGREPSAQQLQHLIREANRLKVKTLFTQQQFANRNTAIIQQSTGTTVVPINPLAYNWPLEMKKIAVHLK